MLYAEMCGDLFAYASAAKTVACHCISADFALGAGIAKEFKSRGVKKALMEQYPCYTWQGGDCLFTETNALRTANLVTKPCYYDKPTLDTIRQALTVFRDAIALTDIENIVMPRIGCGLDKLNWNDVSEIIKDVFRETKLHIVVCTLK